MKFQCGKCEKNFSIDNISAARKDLKFKCSNCDNTFIISKDRGFSSSSNNSRIICDNCGKSFNENKNVCDSCNLDLKGAHRGLKVDNRDYEQLEIRENGHLYNTVSGANVTRVKVLIPVVIAVLLLSLTAALFLLKDIKHPYISAIRQSVSEILGEKKTRQVIHVVIMKSGQTYYAEQVEYKGSFVEITTRDGLDVEIPESSIMQISKAILED